MVSHVVWDAFSDHSIGDLDIPCEYLVQMSTQFVSHCMVTEYSSEALYYEVPSHNGHVVVEVTTYHDRCIEVLAYDITMISAIRRALYLRCTASPPSR